MWTFRPINQGLPGRAGCRPNELTSEVRGQFDLVMVDEYQDTNALQAAILLNFKPDGRGLTVVGGDAQAIYGFRAANVRNILDFPTQFTPPATVVTLEQNYRSTEPILAASNAVIGLSRERFTKNLRSSRRSDTKPALVTVADEVGQVSFVVESILRFREDGTPLKQQAVLSAPRITAPCWRSSWPAATFRLSRSAALSSSRLPTSRTCCRCCAGPTTRPTASLASGFHKRWGIVRTAREKNEAPDGASRHDVMGRDL